jgi:RNA polymerase sigma-70 factor (ECF subfamily)
MLDSKKTSTPQLFSGSTVSNSEKGRSELDQELMAQVKNGSQKAFRLLFDHYKGPVMTYLSQIVKNQKVAEELAQESFLKVYRSRDRYQPQLKFTAWLWTIAMNTALDHMRQKADYLVDDPAIGEIDAVEDSAPGAEEALIHHASELQVKKCMEALTPGQREVLLLRTVGELSYEEIMSQLGLTLPQVKSLLNRAKKSLTQCVSLKGDRS